jgi:Amt family ammonium transporter
MGFVDVAGASVFYVAAGMIGLVGAVLVGPRQGKYNTDGSSNMVPGHNIPLAAAGLALMIVAWLPYVVGAALLHGGNESSGVRPSMPSVVGATLLHGGNEALAAINVILAGSAALVVGFGMSRSRYGKPDILLSLAGLLGGLVAISASAGVVNPFSAVAIGAVAGWLVIGATVILDLTLKIDDPGGLLAAYIVGGAWGTFAVAIFTPQDRWLHRLELLGVQCLGILAIAVLATILGGAVFALFKVSGKLRISEAEEFDGLDLAQLDLNAYPDCQQTMIKSYHLREA